MHTRSAPPSRVFDFHARQTCAVEELAPLREYARGNNLLVESARGILHHSMPRKSEKGEPGFIFKEGARKSEKMPNFVNRPAVGSEGAKQSCDAYEASAFRAKRSVGARRAIPDDLMWDKNLKRALAIRRETIA